MTLDELMRTAKLLGVDKQVIAAMQVKLAEANKVAPAGTNLANLRPAMQAAQLRADNGPVGRFPQKRPSPAYPRRPLPPTFPLPKPAPAPTLPVPQIPIAPTHLPAAKPPRQTVAPVSPAPPVPRIGGK